MQVTDDDGNVTFEVLPDGTLRVKDEEGLMAFEVFPDGTSFHYGHEWFFDGATFLGETIQMGDFEDLIELIIWGSASVDEIQAGQIQAGQIQAESIEAGQKNFRIDHPLKPDTHDLVHSSVESSEMMNVYNGNATLDDNGEAWVAFPDWFDALNKEFRYQLTCIGGYAPVYIAEELHDNRFKIAGGEPGMTVSWQITGIRQDRHALENPIQVERLKDTVTTHAPHDREDGPREAVWSSVEAGGE